MCPLIHRKLYATKALRKFIHLGQYTISFICIITDGEHTFNLSAKLQCFKGRGREANKQSSIKPVIAVYSFSICFSTETALPFISPKFPDPMARSLSFQSFDSSFSILGVSE